MTNSPQEIDAINSLKAVLKSICEIDAESLVRKNSLGDLNFEEAKPFLERNIDLFKGLLLCDLSLLPVAVANELNSISNVFLGELHQIKAFSLQDPNALSLNQQYTQRSKDSYQDYFLIITKYLPYLKNKNNNIDSLKNELQQTINETKIIAENETKLLKQNIETAQRETDEILRAIKNVAGKAGVSQHSTLFADESTAHGRVAENWLKATIIIALITIIFAAYSVYFYTNTSLNLNATQNTQLAIVKIIGFALLFYILKWTAKNYAAHRHNQVTNKHRQNALSTFEAFVKASEDVGTKDAVLLRSTETIFSAGQTGYLIEDKESAPNTQVLEIFRNIPKVAGV